MTAKTLRRNAFIFGKYALPQPQFNNPSTDKHHCSWLADDEFVGRDSFTLARDLHVATGYTCRGGFHE